MQFDIARLPSLSSSSPLIRARHHARESAGKCKLRDRKVTTTTEAPLSFATWGVSVFCYPRSAQIRTATVDNNNTEARNNGLLLCDIKTILPNGYSRRDSIESAPRKWCSAATTTKTTTTSTTTTTSHKQTTHDLNAFRNAAKVSH